MYRDIARAYAAARRRLLLLDYDGTLVDLAPTPPEAKPTAQVIDVLTRLGNDPHNTVVIVSGRDCQTLDAWLGSLPIHLVAEHGGFTKQRGQPWKTAMPTDNQWKKQLRPIMETSVSAVP